MKIKDIRLYKAYDFKTSERAHLTAVFLHGISADSNSFRLFFRYLEKLPVPGLRIIAYDLLGAGKSPTSDDLDYGLTEQMSAIEQTFDALEVTTPVVLCGHSMGTMLAERYTTAHTRIGHGAKETDGQLLRQVLISPPVYTPEDIKNPLFKVGLKRFREAVAQRDKSVIKSKAFKDELSGIVSSPKNYKYLEQANLPTIMIYGEMDRIISAHNFPKILEKNPLITAVKTPGAHGVTPEKFPLIVTAIKEGKC